MSLSYLPVRVFRMRVVGFCSAGLGALLLMPVAPRAAAQAQASVQAPSAAATVRGLITDPDGAIIPGATVLLTPAKGNGASVKSGSDGTFRAQVPAGTYTVSISMEGFATYNRPGVKVTAGQSLTLDAKLIVGDQTQVINVVSDAATVSVDPDNAASSTVIKGKDLEALSDDPDELSAELSALAGPAAGPNGGQIYVDGFTGGQLPPKSSIREIRINQNPFSAEYDKLGYGRVEVFTKPGTDKFHGMLSAQGSARQFNTSNPFLGSADNQPDYHTFFLLGSLTGPLTKSSSFSIGGSRRDISENAIINPTAIFSNSPTSTTLCAPGSGNKNLAAYDPTCGSNVYPVAARALLQPQLRSDISPRLDIALGPKNVLTTRYQYEGGNQTNANVGTNSLPSTGATTSNNEHTIQISDTQTISSKMVNETRFEFQRSESTSTPNSTAASVVVSGTFASGGNSTQTADTVLRHIEVQNYTSLALSTHFLRFGGRLRLNHESSTSNGGANGTFTYTSLLDPCTDPSVTNKPSGCAGTPQVVCDPSRSVAGSANYVSSYQCGTPFQYSITNIRTLTVNASQNDVGLYAEDDWKIKPNLTFSYGLRYEAQNVIHSAHDFAPRFSIAYGIPRSGGKPPMTVVRGGFGIFYDRFSLDNIANYIALQAGNLARQTFTVQNVGTGCSPATPGVCNATASGRVTQYTLDPNLRSSYTLLGAFGFDQQLARLGTVSVNYVASRGNHEFLSRLTPTTGFYNYQYQSEGVFREQQLLVNANIRTRSVNFFGFYALSLANSNTSGANFVPTSTNPAVDYGRASFATRSYAVMGGTYNAPYKFNLSPFLIVRSGQFYNITTGTDVNGDSVINDRPAFADPNNVNCRSAASFITPPNNTTSYNEIPINACTGPANYSLNLRLARTFGFGPRTDNPAASGTGGNGDSRGHGNRGGGGGGGGMHGGGGPGGGRGGFGGGNSGQRYNLTFGVQAQNVFNVVPYSTPVSTLTNARFGTFQSIAQRPFSAGNAVRSITLQATFNF